ILRSFVVASFYIPSESMEPTLHGCATCEPDRVLVDKLSYKFSSVGRKDIVVFTKPDNLAVPDKDLIKRVIGLPGDTVSASGGSVYVNGKKLSEPYVMPSCHGTTDFAAVRVPADQYFVMGDNRCNSTDSRVFGTIDGSSIVGRAFAIVWPLKRLSWL
ncbi:MAG: signal peptidase, partial [Frankiales bacterium]|nr:signal peptidase [Frankiales bacterium]